MTITPIKLSGSTDGKPIKVAANATPGTTIHTAHATALDRIWIWATNTDSTDRALTLEWGGTTSPDDHVKETIPAGSTVLVAAGIPLTNSLLVKAFAAQANVITITGHVDRVS